MVPPSFFVMSASPFWVRVLHQKRIQNATTKSDQQRNTLLIKTLER
jgi:hypothetical protein